MTGVAAHDSVEAVRSFWETFAERQRQAGREFELSRSRKKLVAYVSHNRWVADCECGGGIALWRENTDACCLDCGTVYSAIEWPSDKEIAAAERVLAARVEESTRSWRPDQSETADDLKVENVVRGIPLGPD